MIRRKKGGHSGFTLIEMLIVIAISGMIASLAISYSGTERNQTALSVEKTKLAQFILQARALTLATHTNQEGYVCGYGVKFDTAANTYSLFAYIPQIGPAACPFDTDITYAALTAETASGMSVEVEDTAATWQVQPGNNIILADAPPIIFFYPPEPETFIFNSPGDSGSAQGSIVLESSDQKNSTTIAVNSSGQVNF